MCEAEHTWPANAAKKMHAKPLVLVVGIREIATHPDDCFPVGLRAGHTS